VRRHGGVEPIQYDRHTNNRSGYGSSAMEGHSAFMLNKEPAVSPTTFKQRLFNVIYLTAITVAMIGWLSVFGWAAIAVGKWLLA
jgi:hypothetical protein